MSEKILPLKYPPITTFTGYAAALAILFEHEESHDWVFSHYLQVYAIDIINRDESSYNDDYEYQLRVPFTACFFGDFDTRRLANAIDEYFFLRREGCPYFDIFEMATEIIDTYSNSFSSFIKTMIDLSMYVYTHLDVSQIKDYNFPVPFNHQVLIFGYDDEKKVIHYADFLNNQTRKYSFSTCSYEEIDRAYNGFKNLFVPPVKSVAAIRYNDFQGSYEYGYIRDTVREYIYPNPPKSEMFGEYFSTNYSWINWKAKIHMGVNVYDYLSDFFDAELQAGEKYIDYRLYHAMYDHKEMMLLRLNYLIKKGWLSGAKHDVVCKYSQVRNNMLIIRTLILKFNENKKEELKSRVQLLLSETKRLEIELLKQIFDIE
ncbi:MAG: hypothetical protein FWD05_12480 [Oscillospiraceae bacterium]|nr:hypothetical protein [Oscillospiraceae bacterium]